MIRVLLLTILLIFNIFANSLDDKIKELKSAPKEQRYKIMNQIKMELIKLNQSQREQFLQKLLKNKGYRYHNLREENRFKKNHNCQSIEDNKYKNQHYQKGKNSHSKNGSPEKNSPNKSKQHHHNRKNRNRHK
jgi:hypothetical protein